MPSELTEDFADQLIDLARAHNVDSGQRRPWDELAREAAGRWLTELEGLLDPLHDELDATLRDTATVELDHTTLVHGDFHLRNCLVRDGRVSGVFDWEIAGAGDWRFDLVNLAFTASRYPDRSSGAARTAITTAVRAECDDATAAFMMACQTLRALSLVAARRPHQLERAARMMQYTLGDWWT